MGIFSNKKEKKIKPVPQVILNEVNNEGPKIIQKLSDDLAFRSKQTIKDWRDALSVAENNKNRYYLYNIYNDVLLDTSLSGAIDQRIERILTTNWKITDKNNNQIHNYDSLFNGKWFFDTLKHCVNSIFWGHSLIEMNGVDDNNEIFGVNLIPRKNVIPEYGLIKRYAKDMGDTFSYRTESKYKWLLEYTEDISDLGLLHKLTPIILYKKECLKSWNHFTEIFGIPPMFLKSNKQDDRARKRELEMLKNMASNMTAVIGLEDELEIVSGNKSDTSNFETLLSTLNKEIYKAVLGQTMSSEDSASYSQAYLHNRMFNYKAQKDLRNIKFWINNHMIPKLKMLGVVKDDIKFNFVDEEKLLIQDRINIDTALLQFYDIDEDYISERYNIPITGKKENISGSPVKIDSKDKQKPDVQKRNK
jgi:phage gp29-like protein